MKFLKYITYFLITTSLIMSCNKEDSIEIETSILAGDNSVSGRVDLQNLETGENSGFPFARVLLSKFEEIDASPLDTFLIDSTDTNGEVIFIDDWYVTFTDETGHYEFAGIPAFENWYINIGPLDNKSGTDTTPDGDINETLENESISVSLEEDEHDDGNNFIVYWQPPSPENASLSGEIFIDFDLDGLPDAPGHNINVGLYTTDGISPASIGEFVTTNVTDVNGKYSFDNLKGGYYVVVIENQEKYNIVDSGDSTPNSGDPTTTNSYIIPSLLNESEIDINNNFIIQYADASISGFVAADTDGNDIYDFLVPGERIELYRRNEDGTPTTPLLAYSNTDTNGYFSFPEQNVGEYVIYYIGFGNYNCEFSKDITPEEGEPLGTECFFIPVDLLENGSYDSGNIFLVK